MLDRHRFHILTGTAVALILAAPLVSMAKNSSAVAPIPPAGLVIEQAFADLAGVVPGSEPKGPSATDAATPAVSVAPAATPDPLATLSLADRAIAQNIQELLASQAGKLFTSKSERAAVEAFYQTRNFAPLWITDGVENVRAQTTIARLKNADADGLEPGDYRTPLFAGDAAAHAEAEVKLTRAVLTYARHVQAGRFPYTRVSKNIELPQAAPEPADVLSNIAAAKDTAKTLDAYSPQHEPYRKLKAALADLRAKSGAKGQIDTIVANMERWRWYPRELGKSHVVVNLPDFTLAVMHNGGQVWTTRVVIGKPNMATPLLSETMKFITVNPTWTVPQSIVRNEYLPALAQDPTVLERMGLRVSRNSDGSTTITQPPGESNALGRVRFNFNNRFSVFQHDTPNKDYFSHEVRAYSHGCMRVQDPAKYAEVLMNIARPNEHWTAERIKRMYGGAEQNLQIQPYTIWVHLTYQTALVDQTGKLQTRRDVYSLDSRTIAAIKGERGTVEPSEQRKHDEIAGTASRKSVTPARTGALPQPVIR